MGFFNSNPPDDSTAFAHRILNAFGYEIPNFCSLGIDYVNAAKKWKMKRPEIYSHHMKAELKYIAKQSNREILLP